MDNFREDATPPSELDALRRELAEARAGLGAARSEQAAAAEVLRIVSRPAADAAPVFDAILEACQRLFSPYGAAIYLVDGDRVKGAARRGFAEADWGTDAMPLAGSSTGRAIAERRPVHIADLAEHAGLPEDKRAAVIAYGGMSTLYAPMISGERGVGSLLVGRRPKRPFSEAEIASLSAFADQATIAIENARLFREAQARTRELEDALERQSATAKILEVIASSPADPLPVFEAIAASANTIMRGRSTGVYRFIDGRAHLMAMTSTSPEGDAAMRASFPLALSEFPPFALVSEGAVSEIPDTELVDIEAFRDLARVRGYRSLAFVPLVRRGAPIGLLSATRATPGAFAPADVALLRAFADQAVIAIENARLFEEVRARTREVEEALAQQTATAEVLRVIASSPTDLSPVFEAIARRAAALCEAENSGVFRLQAGQVHLVGQSNLSDAQLALGRQAFPAPLNQGTAAGRAMMTHEVVHIPDIAADPGYAARAMVSAGFRSALSAPMLHNGEAIGAINVTRMSLRPFSRRQIELLETFAAQAVIAIENARLFNETQEALAQQTATADVLKTISRSAFDLDAVFQTLVASAVDLCRASSGTLCVRDGDVFRYRGMAGPEVSVGLQRFLIAHPLIAPTRDTIAGRTILSGRVEEIHDVLREDGYAVPFAALDSPARGLLGVPLIGKGETQGAIVVARAEPGAFPRRQIEILKTFADQAVIAIENARLLAEVQARTRELEQSLADLRKAQDRLVQSEKLASLGQLTAGIAHEIKNPLNFVNNFAALSRELIAEMQESLLLGESARGEVGELAGLIDANLEKVVHHGQRADSIVKNMLLHSREGSGERSCVNVNAMVEEALNLAYHGARAEKPGFQVNLEKTLDPATGEAELYLQEITRVLLNLISNGFYATAKRRETEGPDYQPTLQASTRSLGDRVEIRVRDNGAGVPDEVRAKMFNPFFTTKPAGEGTGLGLSLSHDIVVKQHGGTIEVETAAGGFAEFIITLPRGGAGS